MKRCSKCKRILSYDNFYVNAEGYTTRCKDCYKVYAKAHYNTYKISDKEFDHLRERPRPIDKWLK